MEEYSGLYRLADAAAVDSDNVLAGKTVVITGGARGIGEEMVKLFVKQGAFVAFGDIDETNGVRVMIEAGKKHTTFVKCNVAVWAEQVQLFKTAIAKSPTKSIHVVVQNAGVSGKDPVWWDESEFDGEPVEPDLKILNTNLVGCLYTTKLALHYFARQPETTTPTDRCLILMSSIAGYCEQPGAPVYGSSKHGIRGVMQSLRRTSHQRNVRVNLIAPWYIDTPAIPRTSIEPLASKGVKWALATDAAQAALHITSDVRLNGRSSYRGRERRGADRDAGRCLAIVPRDEDPRGYRDMELDDYPEGSSAAHWQAIMLRASHRAISKDRQ